MFKDEVRNRRTEHIQQTVRTGMSRLENVMGDSVMRFRHMPSRAKVLIFISAVLSLFIYLYLAKWLFQSDSDKDFESLLETEKCPACYGGSACGLIYYKQIEFSGMSKYRVLDILNGKNVHVGSIKPKGKEIVMKKLATDTEIKKLDVRICKEALRQEDCDVARVIPRTNLSLSLHSGPIKPELLRDTGAFMFACPSYRLLDRMWTYFQEFKKKDEIFMSDKMQVLYSALANGEVLMLQVRCIF